MLQKSEVEEIVSEPPNKWPEERQVAVAALLRRVKTGKVPEGFVESKPALKIKESEMTESKAEAEEIYALQQPIELPPSLVRFMAEDPEVFALRYLMARNWHVSDATKMVITASQFRLKQNLDEIQLFPSFLTINGWGLEELKASRRLSSGTEDRKPSEMDRYVSVYKTVPACYHKTDKLGCPVYIERTGKADSKELYMHYQRLNAPGADVEELAKSARLGHVHMGEVATAVLRCENDRREAAGKPRVFQVTTIRDLSGLTLSSLHNPTIALFKEVAKWDKERYGEGISRVIFVNAPSMFTVIWSVVKMWLEERTLKKVTVLKPHETHRLLELIDAENLPEFLGGSCTCGGPTVAEMEAAEKKKKATGEREDPVVLECRCCPDTSTNHHSEADNSFAITELINVKAGKTATSELEIKIPGEKIVWEYAVEGGKGYDVKFNAEFISAPSGKVHQIALLGEGAPYGPDAKVPKTVNGSGVFSSPLEGESGGKVVFSFDNSHSWMTAKAVHFRVSPADDAVVPGK